MPITLKRRVSAVLSAVCRKYITDRKPCGSSLPGRQLSASGSGVGVDSTVIRRVVVKDYKHAADSTPVRSKQSVWDERDNETVDVRNATVFLVLVEFVWLRR